MSARQDAALRAERPLDAPQSVQRSPYAQSFESRPARRMGPVGVDWASIAASAGGRLAATAATERANLMVALASEFGLSPHYLRRIVTLRPLLSDERFADLSIQTLSLATVEVIRRWAEPGPDEARDAARQALEGDLDSTKLSELEKKSRQSKSISSGAASASRRFRERLKDWAISNHSGEATLVKQGPGFEAVLRLRRDIGGETRYIAYVSIGHYSDPALEKKRVREVLLQALGLRQYNDEVTLVCSSERARDFASNFLDENRIPIDLISIKTEMDIFDTST